VFPQKREARAVAQQREETDDTHGFEHRKCGNKSTIRHLRKDEQTGGEDQSTFEQGAFALERVSRDTAYRLKP
jgi:hypothetical protein